MRVAVIAATGRTGQPLVHELLRRGHSVAVLVRTPQKLGDLRQRVDVVTGTSTDPAALEQLIRGADAVVSTLGPTAKESTLHTRTAEILIDVMTRLGVKRFVGVSGAGIDVPGDHKGLRDRAISLLIAKLGGALARDKVTEYEVFAASDTDWTLVRAPRLVDGAATGHVAHDAHRPGPATSIRRADLAVFLADVVEQRLYPQAAPFVSQGRS